MKGRILIVDDNRAMVRTLRDILRLRGWDTGEAYSGDAAVKAQQEQPFDRVLMDIKMPGLDGIAAYKKLRRLFPRLTVILMTAHRIAEVEEVATRVIAKPLDLPALFDLLDQPSRSPATH